MGALDEFADDLTATIADLNAQFAALNERKAKIKLRGNDIAQAWSEHFTDQEAAIRKAEDALNRISNVPLSSAKTQQTSTSGGALSKIPAMLRGEKAP